MHPFSIPSTDAPHHRVLRHLHSLHKSRPPRCLAITTCLRMVPMRLHVELMRPPKPSLHLIVAAHYLRYFFFIYLFFFFFFNFFISVSVLFLFLLIVGIDQILLIVCRQRITKNRWTILSDFDTIYNS
jgi:protein-S-isoprenylcysteine O-methyltransferase Ste14